MPIVNKYVARSDPSAKISDRPPPNSRSSDPRISLLRDGQIRFMGLAATIVGLVLLASAGG